MKTKLQNSLTVFLFMFLSYSFAQSSSWIKREKMSKPEIQNLQYLDSKLSSVFNLNINDFRSVIQDAPKRSESQGKSNVIVSFPDDQGKFHQYRIVEAPVLSESLSIQYPNIKTYLGSRVDNAGVRIRFSVTPKGVNAMISNPNGTTSFIQPVSKNSNISHVIYKRDAKLRSIKEFECLVEEAVQNNSTRETATSRDANDQLLRTFRIAISTNGEYTQFWDDGNLANGDAQADALAQVVSTLNRNNEVFEVDMAITFTLVNGVELIYPDPTTDPYTGNFNAQLQTTLTNTVGEANYDIGHLFAFGGNNGNAGCIGCVCQDGSKGSGFSSHSFVDNDGGPYMSDFFDIDYVPHEIGHQMGANHTWAFNTEGTGVNSEPGSGTTIMGYAGITGADDVQDHSDPYFHYHSINQILNNVASAPNNCAETTVITNNPPVANAGLDYTIPNGTAFILKGGATDADPADTLTYTWEQIDSGASTSGSFGPTLTSGATWRSRPPSTNTDRYMPIIERVINGQLTQSSPTETIDNSSWETVSTVANTLNFALTVRDRSEANGVGQMPQSDFDTMVVTVDGASGPFEVTSQTTAVTWDAGSTQTVTWNVAGTDAGAVNTPTVNIKLSIDGGFTYPFTMASDVPNDGSHDVTVPVTGGDSSTVRVMVEGNNNIFYAINSTNFNLQESEFVVSINNSEIDICQPDNAVYNFTYNTFLGFSGTTNFSVVGLPAGLTAVINPTSAVTDGTTGTITISGTGSLAIGSYSFTLQGTSGVITKTASATLNVYGGTLNSTTLVSPADNAEDVPVDGNLTWNTDANALDYLVEIASDANFTTIVESATVQTGSYTTAALATITQYYWRVTASNQCVTTSPSTVFSFTTANISCSNTFTATDTPITIAASGPNANYLSVITITDNLPITDVNVKINIDHDWNTDLDIFLISPTGTMVELSTDNGDDDDNYTDTVFDQQATTLITAGTSPFTGSFIPEGDLSILNGEMTAGDWTLSVDDDFGGADGGTILEFTLEFCLEGSLSVDDFDANALDFVVYPNPNNGMFNIKMSNTSFEDTIKVSVYDIRGRLVYNNNFENNNEFNEVISLNNAESGIYLLNVTNGNLTETKKIILK